jgi:chromosomal replication initiation ATPase DnaA
LNPISEHKQKVESILKVISLKTGITYPQLRSKKRNAATQIWKDIAIFVTTMMHGISPPEAADAFGVTRNTIIESNLRTLKFDQDKLMELAIDVYEKAGEFRSSMA